MIDQRVFISPKETEERTCLKIGDIMPTIDHIMSKSVLLIP